MVQGWGVETGLSWRTPPHPQLECDFNSPAHGPSAPGPGAERPSWRGPAGMCDSWRQVGARPVGTRA